MIFYILVCALWTIELIAPVSFDSVIYETYLLYGHASQLFLLFVCVAIYLVYPSPRKRSSLIWIALHYIYVQIATMIYPEVYGHIYTIETVLFFTMAAWIMMRPEIKTAKTINKDNIILAFYKGDKGSFLMHLFELFGLPVKSLAIVAGKHALALKSNKKTFQFIDSKNIFRKSKDYVMVDTGKPYTKEYIAMMGKYHNKPASKKGLRMRCIEGVKPLLKAIGPEFEPTFLEQNPSIYFRKVG